MSTNALYKTDIPTEYAMSVIQLLEQRGIAYEQALAGACLRMSQLENHVRLSSQQDAALLANAVKLTGDPGLGYELGLRSTLTMHGFLGYGLMSCGTLREALKLWTEFLILRTTTFALTLQERQGIAELHIRDLAPQTPMRQCARDRLATMSARLCELLTEQPLPDMEIWFADDEPAYYSRYRERLTRTRFGTGFHQIRLPASYLDLQLATANPITLRTVRLQCERERERLGLPNDLVMQVKDLLERQTGDYLTLKAAARALYISSRTLKRKLHLRGFNFRSMVDEARKREVLRHVLDSTLSINEIASRAGYADPANLTRAFRRWTGEPPSQYRARLVASMDAT